MTATDDSHTVRQTAQVSAKEAFKQLPGTEPERSRQAEELDDMIDGSTYKFDMDYLEDVLDRAPTDEEKEEYVAAWKETIRELKREDGLA